jgi:enoyl-CoA hydratase/carnithine racemase
VEVGRFRAKELLMTKKFLSAKEAHQWGLVTRVVPHEELMEAAITLATEIKKMPSNCLKTIKKAINKDMISYEEAFDILNELQASDNAREGLRAFLEKREPQFKGE